MSIKKVLVPLICLGCFIAIGQWIMQSSPEASQGRQVQAKPLLVETQTLARQDYQITIHSFGTVQARRRAEVHALVSGQVLEVSEQFKAGGVVSEGDVLMVLDASEYTLALQEARSQLANAELALAEEIARSEQAARDWSKQDRSQIATDYALRKPQLKAARANLETAKAQLAMAELNLERCQVKSDFSGRILETFVEVGSVVNPGLALATGYETQAAEVRLPVDAKSLPYLDLPEQTVPVDAKNGAKNKTPVMFRNPLVEPREEWSGHLVRTEAAVDSGSQQLYIVAQIDNPFLAKQGDTRQTLKLGQYLDAEILGRKLEQVIVVPSASVYQGRYVYIVEDGRLSKREIVIRWREQEQTIVSEGLSPGEKIVTTALGQVSSGTPVAERSGAADLVNSEQMNTDELP